MSSKKPSGAAFRKERKARDEQAKANQRAREGFGIKGPAKRPALSYDAIPAPDLNNTASLIRYGAQVLAVVMDQTMLDPALKEEDRRRELRDGAAKLGMIRDKASEQDRIEKVASAMGKGKTVIKGSKSLAGVQKPETARRARSVAESGKSLP